MYRIALINMPFAAVNMPSLALTQLKSVSEDKYPGQISVEIIYLNQEFSHYLGLGHYQSVAGAMEHHDSGLGDWFFRQAAFPELPDNSDEYLQRFYAVQSRQIQMFKYFIQQKRQGLNKLMDDFISKYKLDRVDLVGFTSMFSQNVACLAMARKIKEWNPHVVTVMGGANCEFPMGKELARHVKMIDFVFSGPALRSFPEIVGYLLKQDRERCHRVDGVFTSKNCSLSQPETAATGQLPVSLLTTEVKQEVKEQVQVVGITRTPSLTLKPQSSSDDASVKVGTMGAELDLDVNSRLDYGEFLDTFEANFPDHKIEPNLLFETSRGCWWGEKAHCTFCGLNGVTMNYRVMSPAKAIEQFESLFAHAPRCKFYQCVDNILAKTYVKDVFPFISPPSDAILFYEIKADMSKEDLEELSRARVKLIQPGIEALATSTLQLMKKGTSVFQNLILLKNCAELDVFPVWNLLLGFPGEGEAVYQKYVRDIPLLVHLPPPNGAFPVRFDRYSPYYTKAEEYGLNLQPFDFYKLTYPFNDDALANIAYYFVDANYRAEYRLVLAKWINQVRDQVNLWATRWKGQDSALPAKLFFKEQGAQTTVYDSRTGQVIEHQVSDVGKQVLNALVKAKRLSQLASELNHIPGFEPAKEVAFLQERGLVFQEHDRFLSLVLPEEPPISFTITDRSEVIKKAEDTGTGIRKPVIAPVPRERHRVNRSTLTTRVSDD